MLKRITGGTRRTTAIADTNTSASEVSPIQLERGWAYEATKDLNDEDARALVDRRLNLPPDLAAIVDFWSIIPPKEQRAIAIAAESSARVARDEIRGREARMDARTARRPGKGPWPSV